MKNNQILEQVFAEKFELDLMKESMKDIQTEVREKIVTYTSASELERAMLYTAEVTDHAHLKRKVSTFFNEEYRAVLTTFRIFGRLPEVYARKTQTFFSDVFPDFTVGASSALGRMFENAIKRVTEDAHAVEDAGKYMHIKNYIMQSITERSRSTFFKSLRKDVDRLFLFEQLLEEYCKAAWLVIRMENGVATVNMPIAERVLNNDARKRSQIREFMKENIRVSRHCKVDADDVYSVYKEWAYENCELVLTRKELTKLLSEIIPGVTSVSLGEFTYVKGISVA